MPQRRGERIAELLRALSPTDEFIIVAVAAFAPFIAASIRAVWRGQVGPPAVSDFGFLFLVGHELAVLVALAAFLRVRGWTLERIGLGPNLRETLIGVAIAAAVEVAAGVIWTFAVAWSPEIGAAGEAFNQVTGSLHPATLIAGSLVNPIFEEAFLCGYVVTALKDRAGPWTAVNVSAGIRLLYHLYQGVVGVIFTAPFGVFFAYWFVRQGRLWPLIVAHVLIDFVAFVAYMRS